MPACPQFTLPSHLGHSVPRHRKRTSAYLTQHISQDARACHSASAIQSQHVPYRKKLGQVMSVSVTLRTKGCSATLSPPLSGSRVCVQCTHDSNTAPRWRCRTHLWLLALRNVWHGLRKLCSLSAPSAGLLALFDTPRSWCDWVTGPDQSERFRTFRSQFWMARPALLQGKYA